MLYDMLSRLHIFCELGRCTCWASAHRLRSCCRYWRWITGRDSRWIIGTCWAGDVWRVGMGKDRYANIFSAYVIRNLICYNFTVGTRFISLVLASNLWVIVRTVLRKVLSGERFLSGYKEHLIAHWSKCFQTNNFKMSIE